MSAEDIKFKSINTKVKWRVGALNGVDSMSKFSDANAKVTMVTWRIENFSSFKDVELMYSKKFSTVDGNKWRIIIFPKWNHEGNLSVFLEPADSANLPSGWSRYVHVGVEIIPINPKSSFTEVYSIRHEFNAKITHWGFRSFAPLSECHDPKRDHPINISCLVEVCVSTDITKRLISCNLIVETNSEKHKMETVDCPKTTLNNEIVDIEPHERYVKDVTTVFNSLEALLSSSNIVSSQEEAKEALANVEGVLSMSPINFYNSGKFLTLERAINTLAKFVCPSTHTIEQKFILFTIGQRLKELADRAAKAVQDKRHLTENQSMKQVEQKLAAMLYKRDEIFGSSKEIKMGFEALEIEWPDYEASAKVVEEEEKIVEAEWGRMKKLFSFKKEIFENYC